MTDIPDDYRQSRGSGPGIDFHPQVVGLLEVFDAAMSAIAHGGAETCLQGRPGHFRKKFPEVSAHEFFPWNAGQSYRWAAGVGEAPVAVEHADGIAFVVEYVQGAQWHGNIIAKESISRHALPL